MPTYTITLNTKPARDRLIITADDVHWDNGEGVVTFDTQGRTIAFVSIKDVVAIVEEATTKP